MNLTEAIDPDYGIIIRVNEHRTLAFDIPIHIFSAELCNTSIFYSAKATRNNGGASLNREAAFKAAVGESLERYCLASGNRKSWVFASSNELENPCNLDFFPQIPQILQDSDPSGYVEFSKDLKIDWVLGINLFTNQPTWLPANLIYVPYIPSQGIFFDRPISTGAALADSFNKAALLGLLEVIERDAFMLWWLSYCPKGFPISKSILKEAGIYHLLEIANQKGLSWHVFDLTNDVEIPVVVAISRARNSEFGASLSIGAAARLSLKDAIKKAVCEMAHTRAWQNAMLSAQDSYNIELSTINFENISDHPLFWAKYRPEKIWFESIAEKEYSQKIKITSLENLVYHLANKGFDIYAVDITSDDVRNLGAIVVKVIVPKLHPLEVGNFLHLKSSRLAKAIGASIEDITKIANSINHLPHPFP